MYKLLKKLADKNIHIHIENDSLKIKFNGDSLPKDVVEEIKNNKEALLSYLKGSDTNQSYQRIEKVVEEDSYPVSSAQKRLWVLDQVEEGSIAYNMPFQVALNGSYDLENLQEAIQVTIARHEILRTVFRENELGEIRQWILDASEVNFAIDYQDFRNLEGPSQEDTVASYIQKDTFTAFDLENGPLLRVAVLQLADDRAVFYYNMHHIISDGWSLGVLSKDILTAYQAINDGKEIPFSELRIQYKDYAAWQLDQSEESSFSKGKEYWTNQLSGNLPVVDLPTYKKRPALKTNNGKRLTTSISEETVTKLNTFCQERKGSLFMGLVATINALLYRYTQQEDLIIGTPVAGRDHPDLENQIGFYVNTLALRNNVTTTDTFESLFTRVKETTLKGFEYQNYPFNQLVQDLELKRNVSRNTVFDIMLVMHNMKDKNTGGDVHSYQEGVADKGIFLSKFDLEFNFREVDGFMVFDVIYNTDVYDKEVIEGFMKHFKKFLAEALVSSQQHIDDLVYISSEENKLLLEDFNNTVTAYPNDMTVLDLFASQVANDSEKVALVYENDTVTFGELDRKSNQLANYLASEGVENTLIPICTDRSFEMVISILGILKSGNAYVPVDTKYPQKRIEYILEDTAAQYVISGDAHISLFDSCTVINIDTFPYDVYATEAPAYKVTPQHTAYCIYTSGTTGNPKGVLNAHSGLLNRLLWMKDELAITSSSVILQKTPYVFDVSVWELTMPLLAGCSLIMARPEGHSDPEYLQEVIAQNKVTIVHFVPSMLTVFLESLAVEKLESLMHVVCSGEALSPAVVSKFKNVLTSTHIHNLYGPTEAAIDVTTIDLTSVNTDEEGVTIGKPVANTQLYVVNPSNNLQPVGVVGELLIGGVQVSQGYLNKPVLTAEKFIRDRFRESGNLYKTGDLVRWLPNGNIEYLGRKDHQVKIRGYRIELGEIENCIEEVSQVKQAVVLARKDGETKRLVAYVVTEGTLDKVEVQKYLQAKLPEYMVPSIYVSLDQIPLSINGKVDRKALPDPVNSDIKTSVYVAPRTETEQKLAQLWQELLRVDEVGVYDNFFSLGGDSIIAIQLISRAKKEGISFKVKDVFEYQTIDGLSQSIGKEVAIISEQGILEGAMGLLPIHHNFFEKEYVAYNHYNQSVLLNISKEVATDVIEQAIDQVYKKHDALRLQYELKGDTHTGMYNASIPEVEMVTLEEEATSISEEITNICTSYQSSLSIEEGVVSKFVYIKTPSEETSNRLFITVHHLAIDGVSWRIILKDFSSYLSLLLEGKELPVEEKTTSYRQWQQSLQEYASSERLVSEKSYWKSVASKATVIPQDTPYDGITTHAENKHYTVSLSKEQTQLLLQESHQAYGTEINDLLLAALTTSLSSWSGHNEIVIGLEGHGREELFNDVDITETVGWFTSLYPVALKNFENDLEATIVETKENLRAIPTKGIGYGVLRYLSTDENIREELSIDTEQIIFNYLGQVGQEQGEDGAFSFSPENKGKEIGEANHTGSKITINCIIVDGVLSLSWSYDANRFHSDTISAIATGYKNALEAVISLCTSTINQVYTPNDYGLNGLVNYQELKTFKELPHTYQIEDIYKLSPLQEGLLFHSLYGNDANAYILQLSFDMKGAFNLDHFKAAWNLVIKKHSILRTSFYPETMAVPVQCVYTDIDLPLTVIDYRGQEDVAEEIKTYIDKDANTPFNMEEAPLFRLTLVRQSEENTKLIFTNHHILSDGWSSPIIFGEFITNYQSLVHNEIPVTTNQKDDYKDYITYLSKKDRFETLSYWRNHLSNLESPSILPFLDTSEKHNTTFGNTNMVLSKGKDYVLKLEKFAKDNHITINTIVQGLWSYLLSQYTNNQTVVFGTVISGRPTELKGVETRVGLYINTIPLCTTLEGETEITTWLSNLQKGYTTSREEYGHSSLADIQKQSVVGRDLFDSLLVFENYPLESIKSVDSDLGIDNIQMKQQNNYALTISVNHISNHNIHVTCEYNSEVLSDTIIEMIKGHFDTILDSILKSNKIDDLEYLTSTEVESILQEFNSITPQTTIDKEATVLDTFYTQVEKTPDAIAVIFEDKKLTYRELNSLSNKLAHCLKDEYAISSGDLIGIKLDRSEWAVISILGVLKLGAAYVPIDPEYSSSREENILNDSEVKMVITETNYMFDFSEYEGTLFSIDIEFESDQYADTAVGVSLSRKDLAYVIYTSGSTGMPKGVMVTHGSLINYLAWGKNTYLDENQLSNNDFGLYTSLSFDLTVTSLFIPLISGSTLQIFGQGEISKTLKTYIETGISCIKLTPAHISVLKELTIDTNQLEVAIVGGDALLQHHVDILRNINPAIKIYNEYGPTEATVGCMIYEVPFKEENISIGRPILNTEIYIINSSNKLVPNGVVGEICVGGAGLAKGYLNRPELTAERFITHPFNSNELIYKTGDVGRWLPNGNMEYLGREDNQVKIRGYRIELGEIEQQLLTKNDINDVSVIAVSKANGEKELAAYIVFEESQNTITELRRFLLDRLPAYMIPNHFVELEKIPLTVNGKVNKKMLPSVEGLEVSSGVEYVAPRNEIEEDLATLWKEHFEVDQVGIKSDYFQLGGDSIKMIRFISDINKLFDMEFPIATFYENPTIEGISSFIATQENNSSFSKELKAKIETSIDQLEASVLSSHPSASNIANVYPMSDVQMGMILTGQLARENKEYGIFHDQWLFQIGLIDVERLTDAMKLLVHKHETLRTSYHLYDYDEQVQIIHKEVPVHIGFEDISDQDKEGKEAHVQKFLQYEREENTFDVTVAPLWRINIFQINETEIIYALQFHHALLDGWSEKSMRVELFEIYTALETTTEFKLSELKCSMRDSVVSDLVELQNEENISYWKNKVTDHKRLEIFTEDYVDIQRSKAYSKDFSKTILDKCKEDGITPKALFFSGYLYILSMLSFEKDVTLGMVAHRRPMIEDGDKLLGCFLNSVPFRYDMESSMNGSWLAYVKSIESDLNELKGKDRFSLNSIADLAGEKSRKNPFFDVLFNYVDFHILNELYDNEDFQLQESTTEAEDFTFNDFERTNTFLDLTLSVTRENVSITFTQNRALKSGLKIENLVAYYDNFLHNYLHNDKATVNSLDLLSEGEREKILVDFNNTGAVYPKGITLVQAFEEQVRKTPNEIAVVYQDEQLSYRQLDELSNCFAEYLTSNYDIKNDDLIGVKIERSEWVIISILGILKLGAAYLPIDPSYPISRIQFIEKDSNCKLCIDNTIISTFISTKDKYSNVELLVKNTSDDIAYVIYTSGSTGNPKGVMVAHKSILNTIYSQIETFDLINNRRSLQFASFSFDASISESFITLLSGACLYIIDEDMRNNPKALTSYIQEHQINIATLPPAYLKLMDIPELTSIKALVTAGEAPIYDNIKEYLELGCGTYYNAYGPTEVSICGSIYTIPNIESLYANKVSIGKPISNASIYILDKNNNTLPIGVIGEICIGGAGVAKGYLNRSELTQEKFIDNPFNKNERLYKTGDLGKWLPDGNLEFHGRKDDQVKIRGHRIELGEVENQLLEKEEITEAVALVSENIDAEKQLIIYYVSDKKEVISELRDYLSNKLPLYMLPEVYIQMDKMPLTPNGKIDKKTLISLDEFQPMSGVEFVAPSNEIEEKLALIWSEVLKKDKVGIKDSFFEMGGNSLKAIQITSRIRKEFNCTIDVAALYHNATIEGVKIQIENSTWINDQLEIKEENVETFSF